LIEIRTSVRPRREVVTREIFIDDIEEFSKVKGLTHAKLKSLSPKQLPERVFKYGVASILGNKGKFQDWGGERNDLYSSHVHVKGKRSTVAFAFKGPATKPPLVPGKLGKNGDQIQRLFESSSDIFFIQFEGRIAESVPEQMLALATKKSYETQREIMFGVISLEDSHRLRTKYAKHFSEKNIPLAE
jgi:hypothetical protein